eukprot:14920877-Alexandrium_andersonii.AAC.1
MSGLPLATRSSRPLPMQTSLTSVSLQTTSSANRNSRRPPTTRARDRWSRSMKSCISSGIAPSTA